MIKNNKGYTMMESVVAMLLISIIVGGVFSALMASRRAIIEPSAREDMVYAVETVSNRLKAAVDGTVSSNNGAKDSICGKESTPLRINSTEYKADCFLPDVCAEDSEIFYKITKHTVDVPMPSNYPNHTVDMKRADITIDCIRQGI